MKKLFNFLMVGLVFTALQVATVEADDTMLPGMPGGSCDPGPACVENCCGQCDPGPACVENCCPADMTHMPPTGEPHDGPPPGEHPPGEPHDGPPPGEHPPGMPHDGPPPAGDGHHDDGRGHDGPDCAALPTPVEVAACWDAKAKGEHPQGEHHDSQGQTGDHGGIAMCGDVPCSSGEHGEHHEKDCSEIPDAAGRALCEETTAEGRPPTMAECMEMPTEEGRANCKEHAQ